MRTILGERGDDREKTGMYSTSVGLIVIAKGRRVLTFLFLTSGRGREVAWTRFDGYHNLGQNGKGVRFRAISQVRGEVDDIPLEPIMGHGCGENVYMAVLRPPVRPILHQR